MGHIDKIMYQHVNSLMIIIVTYKDRLPVKLTLDIIKYRLFKTQVIKIVVK